jgi:DNA repair ATPase RecN
MARINERSRTGRPQTAGAMMSAEDMKQRVDEFGDRLQQLQAQEVEACKEWLQELEGRHERLKSALEEYIKMLTMAGKQVQTNYQNLREYVSAWAELTNAFNRVFNRGQETGRSQQAARGQAAESSDEKSKTSDDKSSDGKAHDGKAHEELKAHQERERAATD